MKIVSFNTNSIRARPHQLQKLVDEHQPDIIGIQETKVQDEDFPLAMIEDLGYQVAFHGQKAHYGVAILSRLTPLAVHKGFPHDDEATQRRLITAIFPLADGRSMTVLNGYFPQGESRDHELKFMAKSKFYRDLLEHLQQHYDPQQALIIMGDMNVAPLELDIGIGADNARRWLKRGKCSFLPEEREWLQHLLDWGLVDTYRKCFPQVDNKFSWFDYRSRGFERDPKRGLRIDLLLATDTLADVCSDAGISYSVRSMEKPSDHCPIWATFNVS
jgi:exodeoxyribonuclease-3